MRYAIADRRGIWRMSPPFNRSSSFIVFLTLKETCRSKLLTLSTLEAISTQSIIAIYSYSRVDAMRRFTGPDLEYVSIIK